MIHCYFRAVGDETTSVKQAVILAAGKGTRLRPLTYQIPKPMIQINDKPFLQYLIELVRENGIRDIVICVGYLHNQIIEYFGDGSNLGVEIRYSIEKEPFGTGPTIRNAAKFLDNHFMLLNGDTYLPIKYSEFIEFYETEKKIGGLVVSRNAAKQINNNLTWSDGNLIVKYEKGSDDKSLNGMDGGVAIFKKEVLDFLPSLDEFSFEETIFPQLIKKKELAGFRTETEFYDIGSFEELEAFRRFVNDHI